MRYGLIILAFSVALAGESQGRATAGDGPLPPGAPNGPIKCGWGAGPHVHEQLAKTTAWVSRPERQVTYLSTDGTFAVHYDTTALGPNGMDHSPDLTDSDTSGTPDWVEEVAVALTEVRDLLLELRFDPAPDDGDGIYDVYLAGNLRRLYDNIRGETYGLTNPETHLGGDRWTSYIELDNDFSVDESFFTNGLDGARVTVAHEYFHAVQMGYVFRYPIGFFQDKYLYELASTWFEDVAFPEINDWAPWFLAGTGAFGRSPVQPLADTDGYSIAIFGHYLTEKYGLGLMTDLWIRFPSASNALVALRDELTSQNTNLTAAWTDFVAGLFFNGTDSEYLFYPDQVLLGQPMIAPPQVLADSVRLTFA
ncbi:MAG: MXAN_6640 family putative metalloprotease, partial [Candidatus Neomarinimicrobiota bacterium]